MEKIELCKQLNLKVALATSGVFGNGHRIVHQRYLKGRVEYIFSIFALMGNAFFYQSMNKSQRAHSNWYFSLKLRTSWTSLLLEKYVKYKRLLIDVGLNIKRPVFSVECLHLCCLRLLTFFEQLDYSLQVFCCVLKRISQQDGGKYEAAVFAAQCSNLKRMLPICTNWEVYLSPCLF